MRLLGYMKMVKTRLFAVAILIAFTGVAGATAVFAGDVPPPGIDPGPEPTIDEICEVVLCLPGVQQVVIDIKPGDEANCFNNDGHGVIPVAILGSATLDVTQVVLPTVRLNSLAVKSGGNANLLDSLKDINGDGFTDLLVRIEDGDGVFSRGAAYATLTAILNNTTPIMGIDNVCIVQ